MDSSELRIYKKNTTSTSPKVFYITITLEMYYYHMHMLQYNPLTTFWYIRMAFINIYISLMHTFHKKKEKSGDTRPWQASLQSQILRDILYISSDVSELLLHVWKTLISAFRKLLRIKLNKK